MADSDRRNFVYVLSSPFRVSMALSVPVLYRLARRHCPHEEVAERFAESISEWMEGIGSVQGSERSARAEAAHQPVS